MKSKKLYSVLASLCVGTAMFPLMSSAIVTPTQPSNIASVLNQQYRNTTKNCGGTPLRPAYMCSGVMLRGTMPSTEYHSWNPSPSSTKSGGTSFSYLRADSNFAKLAYGYKNGFILTPPMKAGQGQVSLRSLCMFPVDGDTDQRDHAGCGTHVNFPKDSRECMQQGIKTSDMWLRHYNKVASKVRRRHECSFDLTQSDYSANAFMQSLYSHTNLGRDGFMVQNEMRVSTWPQDIGNKLPIQAFFYTEGGLDGARHDQLDYFNVTKKSVPIVKLTLPRDRTQQAYFSYLERDQAVKQN